MSGATPVTGVGYRVYGYRWVVLGVFMLANLAIQILWISYAPITTSAAVYFGVSESAIGWFSMVFMVAFVPLSLPAAWLIDTRGLRSAVGLGVALMAVFGVLRGFAGDDFTLAFLATFGIAVAQPFLLNSWTTMASNWFPTSQRATAVGLITLANLVGTGIGMVLTPVLTESMGIDRVQLAYGIAGAVAAAAFLALARERPATPPCPVGMGGACAHARRPSARARGQAVPRLSGRGVRRHGRLQRGHHVGRADRPPARLQRGRTLGLIGGLMLLGGLLGAVILSALSDRGGRRVRYLALCLVLAVPGLLGVALVSATWLLLLAAFALGFFLVPALPIGMQYAAEVTYPTPEGTSNGLVQLFGQVAVVYVYFMAALRLADGSFIACSLLLSAGLLLAAAVAVSRLREPPRAAGVEDGGGAAAAAVPQAGAPRPPAPIG